MPGADAGERFADAPAAPAAPRVPVAAAFDALAPAYDDVFSDHPSGRIVRRAVWRVADGVFAGADRVLDLGCGTGVDALHLAARGVHVVALDIAPQMVARARCAAAAAGCGNRVAVHVADVGQPATWPESLAPRRRTRSERPPESERPPDCAIRTLGRGGAPGGPDASAPFAGALSDFGVLNCIGDLAPLGSALGRLVRPGGRFVAVVMGRACAWETALGMARGDVRRATRRQRERVDVDLGTGAWPIWYRSPRTIARQLGPAWSLERAVGIGAVVPPSWAVPRGSPFDRPWLWRGWEAVERIASRVPTAAAWSDHVAIVLRRVARAEGHR